MCNGHGGDRRADSQWARGKSAGTVSRAAGKGICRAKGTDRYRHPDCWNAVPSQDCAGPTPQHPRRPRRPRLGGRAQLAWG